MADKDKKPKQSDDDFGFEPITDDEIGFELAPEDQAKVKQYLAQQLPGMGESALLGAEQGLTLNHAPQLGAGIGAGLEALAGNVGMKDEQGNSYPLIPGTKGDQSLSDLYNEYLTANKKRDQAAQANNPWSYGGGAVGGGLLGLMGAAKLAKPVTSAISKASPALGATGQLINRTAPGVIPAGIAGGVMAEGAGEHPILSPEGAQEIAEGVKGGLEMGVLAPPAISGVAKAAKKTAQGGRALAKFGTELMTGGEGTNAFKQGLQGELLVGKDASQRVSSEVNKFGEEVPQLLENELNKLASQKESIIRIAQENGVRIDPADVDRFMMEHMSAPIGGRPKVVNEMQQLKDLLEEARSGPEVKQITRRYFGNGNTEKGEFANLFAKKQAEMEALEKETQARVTPTTQKEDFEQLFAEKQAEQVASPGSMNPTPMEIHYEPIDGQPGKVLGMIRQPLKDADGHFTGYKTIAKKIIEPDAPPFDQPKLKMTMTPTEVPGKSLGQIHKAEFDEHGNFLKYKTVSSKLLTDEEAAAFKDVAETVRAGGRDLTEPEQLLDLYKNLKEKSKFGSEPFGTAEVQKETGRAIKNIQDMLRRNIDELEPTDANITALKNAQEIFGNIDGQKDPYGAIKLVGGLISKSGDTSVSGDLAQRKLADAINQIKIANPKLGHELEARAMDLANKLKVTAAAQEKVYLPRPLATPQAFAAKGANLLGYGIGQVTPDWMRQVASAVGAKGGQAGKMLSNVLSKAAEKDDQTRTAIMFGLMQQPGYRDMLKEYMPQTQDKDQNIQNSTLEEFK